MSITDKQDRTLIVGPVAISQESFDGIADTIGGAIGYWANRAQWDKEAQTVTITENDEGEYETHVVTYDKVHETFWKIVSDPEIKLNSTVRGYFISSVLDGLADGQGDIDAGHIDGDAADALIQLAIFGKIVFG